MENVKQPLRNRGLTAKQERFVTEYLTDLNATAAAGRAGYKDPNIGRQVITKDNVRAAIDEGKRARAERTEITADLVVQETWKNYQRCVEAEEFSAANKALELLGRHTGAFPKNMNTVDQTTTQSPSPSSSSPIKSIRPLTETVDRDGQ